MSGDAIACCFVSGWNRVVASDFLVRHVINARAAPRVAAADAVCGQVAAFDAAVFLQCFERIGRAGWLIAAAVADVG
jgi:hypothetical protein